MAMKVGAKKHSTASTAVESVPIVSPPKRPRTSFAGSGMLDSPTAFTSPTSPEANSTGYEDRVEEEFNKHLGAAPDAFGRDYLGDDGFEKTLELWDSTPIKTEYPCLSEVVKSVCACLPGSGGLELDIGRMPKIVSPQRGSLSPAFIEANLFVNLIMNKAEYVSSKVKDLGDEHMEALPKRKDKPIDYFVNEVLEKEQAGGQVDEEISRDDATIMDGWDTYQSPLSDSDNDSDDDDNDDDNDDER